MPIRFAIERVEPNRILNRFCTLGLALGTMTTLVISSGCRSPGSMHSNQPSFDRLMEIENGSATMPPSFQSQVNNRRPSNSQQQAVSLAKANQSQMQQDEASDVAYARLAQKPKGSASRRISDIDEQGDGVTAVELTEKQELIRNMQRALAEVNASEVESDESETLAINTKPREISSRRKGTHAGSNDRYSIRISDDDESGLKSAEGLVALRPVPSRNKDAKSANRQFEGTGHSDQENVVHASHTRKAKEDSTRSVFAEMIDDSEPTDAYPREDEQAGRSKKQLTWEQNIRQAIKQLESIDQDSLEMPQSRIRHQVLSRMLAMTLDDRHEMLKPVDGLQPSEQDYFNYQLSALADAIDPDANPSASRKWSTVMINQQKAHSNLASMCNLEIHNLTFCTNVTDFGVLEPFRTNVFKPNEEVLLYLELDNFVSVKSSDGKGFETDLQGSYEIIDAGGRRVVSQTLPRDTHVCKNMRRDYFIAYRIYMPEKINSGGYTLKVVIEDLKGRKFGQKEIQFQIQ